MSYCAIATGTLPYFEMQIEAREKRLRPEAFIFPEASLGFNETVIVLQRVLHHSPQVRKHWILHVANVCCKTGLMKYGCARVGTDDQNADMQHAALKKAGCKKLFTDDGTSGATTKRPALLRCLKTLQPGDTLMVWKLDRLGRSLRDLITMLDDLKRRGVKFRSLTEAIDTETPTGRAMWQMIGILAELERSLIAERTREGVKAARARGVKFGRKPKLGPQQIEHARELLGQKSREEVAALFKVDRSTLYRALALA